MRFSFKTFIEQDAGASPMSGMGDTQSGAGDTHNAVKKYSSYALDMDQDEFLTGEQGNVFVLFRPYKFKRWGFVAEPPIPVTIMPIEGSPGMNKVTFQLSLQRPAKQGHLFYKPNETPIKYKGPREDKTEIMSDQEVDDMRAQYATPQPGMSQGMPPPPPTGMPQ